MGCKKDAQELLSDNGYSGLNTKELLIILHQNLQKQIDDVKKNQESQTKTCSEHLQRWAGTTGKYKAIVKHIEESLPEKGFCEKVANALELDESGQSKLNNKVNTLWHDRKWIKGMAGVIIAIFIATLGNLLNNFL